MSIEKERCVYSWVRQVNGHSLPGKEHTISVEHGPRLWIAFSTIP